MRIRINEILSIGYNLKKIIKCAPYEEMGECEIFNAYKAISCTGCVLVDNIHCQSIIHRSRAKAISIDNGFKN